MAAHDTPPPPRRQLKQHPQLYDVSNLERTDITADRIFSFHDNGTVTREYVPTLRLKRNRVTPSTLDDKYARWKPFHSANITSEQVGKHGSRATGEEGEEDEEDEEDVQPDFKEETSAGKRKRYASSDDPNGVWRPYAVELLHELYRFDGLGDSFASPCCSTCGALDQAIPTGSTTPNRLFRCHDCSPLLECLECCVERHRTMPLHSLKEWRGTHFERVSLRDLGLVYQLGHGGLPCLSPEPQTRRMVLLHVNGIHEVSFQYCGCNTTHRSSNIQQLMRVAWYPATITDPRTCATFRVLDCYRELNVRANVNVDDFIDTLLALTNAIEMSKLPDRRRAFSRMLRQWNLLHHLKRTGVGMSIQSLDDIPPGSLAVLCWACPHPNMNLPVGWESIDPKYFYLYMPVLALDANFRLKNRYRPNEKPDPELAPGSGYFVDPTPYKDFLKDYVSESDISTCIAFAALLEKDTKLMTGLKTSGVAGCACARHELIRPQGVGDLQKGERYANMDFVLLSAIQGYHLPHLAFSYDIACQYRQNFWTRMEHLPEELQLNQNETTVTFGLPTWHAVAHDVSCRTANALTYQDGLGRTDGEGIERIWSALNPASYATKVMGEGLRHDSLDDRVDHHNYTKNLAHGRILAIRLVIAIEERDRQCENFNENNKALDPKVRAEWKKQIDDWKANRELPSPYLLTGASKGPSETEVLAQLKAEEAAEKRQLRSTIRGTSAETYLGAGLELEDLQIRIRRDTKAATTSYQRAQVEIRRKAFFKKLDVFRELQHIYAPGALRAVQCEEALQGPHTLPEIAENVKLWLPSDFSHDLRVVSCVSGIAEQEERLRQARCNDALVALRHYLHAKENLIAFRNANVTGQNDSTRARGTIDNMGDKVDAEAEKYRRSRQALLSLRNVTAIENYPELLPSDIALDQVNDVDRLALVKLGKAGSKKFHRATHVSTGTHTVTWIWTAQGGPTDKESTAVRESARVEWSKSLARKERWCEEVNSLREEMRRVLRYLNWRICWWKTAMPTVENLPSHLPATAITFGIHAYAFQQVAYLEQILAEFSAIWGAAAE